MKRALSICVASILSATAVADEGHLDVMPVSVIGQPTRLDTGAFDFDGFAVAGLPPLRKFESDLEEPLPGADLLAGESGFSAISATAAQTELAGTGFSHLPGGVNLRFDFRAFDIGGVGLANLWYWDGVDDNGNGDFSDDIDFAPASGVTLSLERDAGLFSASVNGSTSDVNGFVIGTTLIDDLLTPEDETGFLHLDLDALLDDADNDAGTPLPLGVYVISLSVSHDGGAAADPIFWVYNGGLGEDGEAAVEAAFDFVPEPGSLALLLVGAALLRRRSL